MITILGNSGGSARTALRSSGSRLAGIRRSVRSVRRLAVTCSRTVVLVAATLRDAVTELIRDLADAVARRIDGQPLHLFEIPSHAQTSVRWPAQTMMYASVTEAAWSWLLL